MWSIWLARNDNYHKNRKDKINTNTPYTHAVEFLALTNQRTNKDKPTASYVRWEPPNTGYKLNTDGSSLDNPGKSGIGGVIRDKNGNWVAGFMGNVFHATNIASELYALQKDLSMAHVNNLTPLEIDIDCKEIIHLLANDHPTYTYILSDCRELLRKLGTPQCNINIERRIKLQIVWLRKGLN